VNPPAISSLPVPVSPRISTVVLLLATFRTTASTLPSASELPTIDRTRRCRSACAGGSRARCASGAARALLDLDLHLLDLERLLHEVERAPFIARRPWSRPEGRHENHRRGGMQRLGRAEHLDPSLPPSSSRSGRRRSSSHGDRHRGVAVGRLHGLVTGLGERPRQAPPQRVVIVRRQEFDPYSLRASGATPLGADRQRDRKPGALAGAVSMSMCPVVRVQDLPDESPGPAPNPGFVVKNGLKSPSATSGGIPARRRRPRRRASRREGRRRARAPSTPRPVPGTPRRRQRDSDRSLPPSASRL